MTKPGYVKIFIVLCILSMTFLLSGCGNSGSTVYDNDGKKIGTVSKAEKSKYYAYLEIVNSEAIKIISEEKDCEEEEAISALNTGEYDIYTAFDENIYNSFNDAVKNYSTEGAAFGSAVTDLNGHLIAAYSFSEEKEKVNFANKKTAPYSSFKPLSVYLPALESGDTYWSKMYEDSAIKKIENEDGTVSDWPSNASGTYSNEKVAVCEAIKESLNTVAVKCLSDYGVAKSLNFMEETFDLNLEYEKHKLSVQGEDEVIGNIALGYLNEGVSPVDMAGYYQVFANGGKYIEPKAIVRICDKKGNLIYENIAEENQVISKEAAYVMNNLLKMVVDEGGTGEKAAIEGLEVGGKTGTGPNGNWFVGFTPEYSCAVWHNSEVKGSNAAAVFSESVSRWKHDKEKKYPESKTVKEAVYCQESGKLFTTDCEQLKHGYYLSVKCPADCDKH